MLAVASDLFYRFGVRAVSVDVIVKVAGVVKPTFYRSYPSKDLLITACVSADADQIHAGLRAALASAPAEPRRSARSASSSRRA